MKGERSGDERLLCLAPQDRAANETKQIVLFAEFGATASLRIFASVQRSCSVQRAPMALSRAMSLAIAARPPSPETPETDPDACGALLVHFGKDLAMLLDTATDSVQHLLHNHGSTTDAALEAVFKGLSQSIIDMVTELSEGHTRIARQGAKAAKAVFHMKLSHSRTASSIQLQNQAKEMEAVFHRRIEETISATKGNDNTELEEAHKELEEIKHAFAKLKMNFNGTATVLSQTKDLLRSAEDAAASAQADVERVEKETAMIMATSNKIIHKALSDLDRPRYLVFKLKDPNRPYEDTLKELAARAEKQSVEKKEVRAEMDKLIHDLGFVIEEKSSLADQVAALTTQVNQERTTAFTSPLLLQSFCHSPSYPSPRMLALNRH